MVTMTNFANAMAVFAKYFEEYDLSMEDNMSICNRKLHIYLTASLVSDEDTKILKREDFCVMEEPGAMLSGLMQLMTMTRRNRLCV